MGQSTFEKIQPEPQNSRRSNIKVATLNYCGIAFSPFEFYFSDYNEELKEISSIFRKLVPQYVPNFNEATFKWEMGKIEKNFKKKRYSPMFDPEVGVFWGRFITREEFQHKWDVQFTHSIDALKINWTKEEKDVVRLYDFIMYHTLLAFVFKTLSFGEAIKNDTSAYLKKLKPLYAISFLNEQKKLDKFMSGFLELDPDVFFIQEYSSLLFTQLKRLEEKYHVTIDPKEDSLVIIKRASFKKIIEYKEIIQEINSEQQKSLKWAHSIAVIGADNYIFGSVHLSSQQAKNKEQVANLRQDLLQMKKYLPKYEIIVGGDLNSFMQSDPVFGANFHLFPRYEYNFTTLKKRTYAQAQFHKADKEIKESKDRIISTINIEQGFVCFLNGEQANDTSYLPTHDHPHDHFLCTARLAAKKK